MRSVGGAAWAGFDATLGGDGSLTVELASFCKVLGLLLKSPTSVTMRMVTIAPATVQTQTLLARPVRNIGSGCNVVSKLSGLLRSLMARSVSFHEG